MGIQGKKMSEEAKRKISIANKGKPCWSKGKKLGKRTEEARKKMRDNHWSKKEGFVSPLKGFKHSKETIEKMRNRFKGIPISEEHKNKISNYWKNNRKEHNFWKDGRSTLHALIRTCVKNIEWRKSVFKRDNFVCQECGAKNGNGKSIKFEAHHKKRFSIILNEFLKEYDQFSPVEDKETLLKLAIKYKSFWDLDNGITLCNKCHDKTRGRVKEALYYES